jgi:hypothetical protein
MARLIDPIGRVHGRLTVIAETAGRRDPSSGKLYRRWICVCECGNFRTMRSCQFTPKSDTKSCGCLNREKSRERRLTHGASIERTAEYGAWVAMKTRCLNPNGKDYLYYGGRGIRVAPEWINDFPAFLEHVGLRPTPQHSLDRWPDNDGDYEPYNVRWATKLQQSRNRRPAFAGNIKFALFHY